MIDEYSNIYNTIPTNGEEARLLIEQTSMQEDLAFFRERVEFMIESEEKLRLDEIDHLHDMIDNYETDLSLIDSPILRASMKANLKKSQRELARLESGGTFMGTEIPIDVYIPSSINMGNFMYTPMGIGSSAGDLGEGDLYGAPLQEGTEEAAPAPFVFGGADFFGTSDTGNLSPELSNPAEHFFESAKDGRVTDYEYSDDKTSASCQADIDGDGIYETTVIVKDGESVTFEVDTDGDGVPNRRTVYNGYIKIRDNRDENIISPANSDIDIISVDTRETYVDADGDGVFEAMQIEEPVISNSVVTSTGNEAQYRPTAEMTADGNFTVKEQFLLNSETGQMESLNTVPTTADEKAALEEKQARFSRIYNNVPEASADVDAADTTGADDKIAEEELFIPRGHEPGEYDTDNDGAIDTVLTARQGEYGTEISIVQDTDGDGVMGDRSLEALFMDIDGDGIYSDQFTLIDEDGDSRFDSFFHDVIDEQGTILEHEELDVPQELNDLMTVGQIERYDPTKVDPEAVSGDPESAMEHWESQGDSQRCTIYSQKFVIEELTGVELDVDQLAEFAKENGWFDESYGSDFEDMNKLLDSYGIENELTYENNMSDIESAIERGDKVITCIDADEIWYGDNDDIFTPVDNPNHAVEVIGIDRTDPENPKVILNDSGTPDGAGEMVPFDVFEDAWEDSGKLMITAR